jgi:glutamyl-tRNA reductase
MNLLLTGLNHRTAPVDLRERLDIPEDSVAEVTHLLLELPGVEEAMVLSTCNRVEILVAHRAGAAEPDIERFLGHHFGVTDAALHDHLYHHRESEAIRHLFRVACSLDSLVLGEPQILGQVKAAYNQARENGAVRSQLEKLLQETFAIAKRVRTETEIGSAPVSIASVAVDLARRIFGSLDGKRVMLVGAGKMSELAARHLVQHGADHILVANRTLERAENLARKFGGSAVPFDSIFTMHDVPDIMITSTGASQPILRTEHVQQFLHRRRRRPMLLIDIAVPRDVAPEVNRLEGAFLYDIDDLQSVASANLVDRRKQAEAAEALVASEAERFHQRRSALDIGPMVAELQQTLEQLCQAELRRAHPRLQSLDEDQQAAVKHLARGLMNKFMHLPLQALRTAAQSGDAAAVKAIHSAFDASLLRGARPKGHGAEACPHPSLTHGLEDAADETAIASTKRRPS